VVVDPKSVQTWRTLYYTAGIEGVKIHNKKGFKPSVFTEEEHKAIEQKLKIPLMDK